MPSHYYYNYVLSSIGFELKFYNRFRKSTLMASRKAAALIIGTLAGIGVGFAVQGKVRSYYIEKAESEIKERLEEKMNKAKGAATTLGERLEKKMKRGKGAAETAAPGDVDDK